MIFLKNCIILLIFIISFLIGNLISKKYVLRVKELQEIQNALGIIKSKIKYTYEPLPEIFRQTARLLTVNIARIFIQASKNMRMDSAENAWEQSLNTSSTNLKKEDIESLQSLGKMLGKTDKDGQVNQLELTQTLIDIQIKKAMEEESKNAKLFKTLGTIIGLAFVIILM